MTSKQIIPIEEWVSLRYRPHVPRFHGCGPTKSFDLFDWVIWAPMDDQITRFYKEDPKTILCLATNQSVDLLLEVADFNSMPGIVFAGEDTLLSTFIERIEKIADKFSKIFYEAKDIESDLVRSFSMGFTSFYLRDSVHENIYRAIDYSNRVPKSELVLAAWGERWKHLDQTIDERWTLNDFLEQHEFITRRSIPFDRYWKELAKHKFSIAPRGQGIQAPKLAESWMVKTMPIAISNPCFRDLEKLGYPIILIEGWSELTKENFEIWSEHYERVDWELTRYKLTNRFLEKLLRSPEL